MRFIRLMAPPGPKILAKKPRRLPVECSYRYRQQNTKLHRKKLLIPIIAPTHCPTCGCNWTRIPINRTPVPISLPIYHRGQIQHTTGYDIESVTVSDGKVSMRRLTLLFRIPACKSGCQKRFRLKARSPSTIKYKYTIPGDFGGRTDFFDTKNGKIYEIAQWFPRMCVYDCSRGWDTLPFLGAGEFYLEYGDIDYSVTVPGT